MMLKALVKSMRLRTLPLSLSGVIVGGVLGYSLGDCSLWTLAFLFLTTVGLQVLSNMSNEMGDYRSGVDGDGREGPTYSLASGGLSEKDLWRAINAAVVFCCLSGVAMTWLSFGTLLCWEALILILLGAAAIWASTHYTLGKSPYGYKGLGDLFVFLFFGLVSVLGSYYVATHTLYGLMFIPATGIGLLSVAVLNVNNIRDMDSDEGKRKTIPLRVGLENARFYQTSLVMGGAFALVAPRFQWWLFLAVVPLALHLWMVWTRKGKRLDPALPILVMSTFLFAILYTIAHYGLRF